MPSARQRSGAGRRMAPERTPLLCVVEDDAERGALAGEQLGHAVPHLRARPAARAGHGPQGVREDDRLAEAETDRGAARLHARALLGEQELAARVLLALARQHDRDLEREGERAVDVLVEAVVVAGLVVEQERRGPRLPGGVAAG